MIDPMEVVEMMCERYQSAVSAHDSAAYGRLFTADAIRVPPGTDPEPGSDVTAISEQKDYEVATWSVQSRLLNDLWIDGNWVYGIAEAEISTVAHETGATKAFKATKT